MKDLPTEPYMVLGRRPDLRRRLAVAVVGAFVLNLGALLVVDEAKAQDLDELSGGGSGGGSSSLGEASGSGGGGDNGGQQPLESVPAASDSGSTYDGSSYETSSGGVQPANGALSGASSSGELPAGTYNDASGDANTSLGGTPAWETAEPVAEPAGQALGWDAQSAEPVVYDEATTPVEPALETVNGAAPVLEPVGETAQQVVVPVAETAQPVVAPIQEAAQPIVEPTQEAARPVVAPIQETVEPVLAPVQETAQPIVAPIQETAAPVLEPVVGEPVAPAVEPAASIIEPISPEGTVPVAGLPSRSPIVEGPASLPAFSAEAADASYGPTASSLSGLFETPASLRLLEEKRGGIGEELLVPRSGQIVNSLISGIPAILGGSAEAGGASSPAPFPSPSGAPPAGSSLGGSGSAGGFGLAALALFSILLLSGKLSWAYDNFLRPNSAFVLAIERPG